MDDTRLFAKFLSALYQRRFEDVDVDADYIKEHLFESESVEEINNMMQVCEKIILLAGKEDWDASNVERRLDELNALSESQRAAFLKFWRSHKEKVAEHLGNESVFGETLESLRWRVDVKYRGKNNRDEGNVPCAIVELNVKHPPSRIGDSATQEAVRFEMNREQLVDAIAEMDAITRVLASSSGAEGDADEDA